MLLTRTNQRRSSGEALDRLYDLENWSGFFEGVHYPAVNIRISEESARVEVDLPGVEKENIRISVEKGQLLTVKAERNSEELGENEKVLLNESASGSFTRVIQIPFRVDDAKTEAEFKNGVLKVTLYKSEEEKPRKIEIA